jgi:hypothetical protein
VRAAATAVVAGALVVGSCLRNVYGVAVCVSATCASDADCKADACGRCRPGVLLAHGGVTYLDPSGASCAYGP